MYVIGDAMFRYRLNLAFILVLLLMLSVIISGCGGECKESSDCSKMDCHTASCIKKTCEYNAVSDCCGNDICENSIGENECTCPKDCGACTEKESDSTYLTYFCNDKNKCVFGMDESKVNVSSITSGSINSKAGTYQIESVFNQPFNIDEDTFSVMITMKDAGRNTKNMVIDKIELTGTNEKKQKITLGSNKIHRPVWKAGDVVNEDIIINPEQSTKETKITSMVITVYFSYDSVSGTRITPSQASFQYKYSRLEFIYADPDINPNCLPQSEWDDNNPGTNDICSPSTDYFVMHFPIKNACGNYICDEGAGESECNCAEDCGLCLGDAGSYMEMRCDSKQNCISYLKGDTLLTPNTIFDEQKMSYFKINTKISYDVPFNLNYSTFDLEFDLKEIESDHASNVKIAEVRILEGKNMVYEESLNQIFSDSPITVSSKPDYSMNDYEKDVFLAVKIWYQYTFTDQQSETSEEKYGTFQVSLGKIVFINPGI